MLAAIASMILILVLLFTAVQIGINDSTFINNEYTKLNIARGMGMNNADLVNACLRLIDYMQGDVESIDIMVTIDGVETLMFDQEQEIVHMADVQKLYLTCEHYRDMGLLAMLVLYLIAAALAFRSALKTIAKGFLWGAFVMSLLLGFLGTWAALDFNSFWTAFHEALFWNDLWLFDPTTSRMINMLPAQFFEDLVLRIVLIAAAALVVLIVAAILTLVTLKRRAEKAREAARQKHAPAAGGKRRAQDGKTRPQLTEEERRARAKQRREARAQKEAQDGGAPQKPKQPRDGGEQKKPRRERPAQQGGTEPAAQAEAPQKKRKKRPADDTQRQTAAQTEAPRRKRRPAPAQAEMDPAAAEMETATEIDLFASDVDAHPEIDLFAPDEEAPEAGDTH